MDNQKPESSLLDDSALEGVTGGTSMGRFSFYDAVNPGSCTVGMWYYLVVGLDWYYAQLEKMTPTGKPDEFTFTFNVDTCNGLKIKDTLEVKSSRVEVYDGAAMKL